MNKNNIGSSFDDFLEDEALLYEARAVAVKRVIAWQIAKKMKAQKLTKTSMAKNAYPPRSTEPPA